MSRKPRGQVIIPGLPHRRYSVPETVMRKYALTKQQSSSSDSGVATVPVATPDTIQPASSSDDPTAGTSSSDSSDHKKMGNEATKAACCSGHTESTKSEATNRSTLHTVSEEISETVSENCTESNSEPKSSSHTLLEKSSFGPRKCASPQNTAGHPSQVSSQNDLSATPTVMAESRPISKPNKEAVQKPSNIAAYTEPLSSAKGAISSSQAAGPEFTDSKPSRASKEEHQSQRQDTESTEPQSSLKDDSSSPQTTGIESTDSTSSNYNKKSRHSPKTIPESVKPQSSFKNDLPIHTPDVQSTESTPQTSNRELTRSPNTEENVETGQSISSSRRKHAASSSSSTEGAMQPQTSSRIDMSSSQTMGITSTESRSSSTPERASVTTGESSRNRISAPKLPSQMSTETPVSDVTQCSPPRANASGTPTDCCITTSDPEHSHSLSSISDRASESCSITPVESSISASSPERPSVTIQSLVSSVSPPSTDHTVSTQDTTLSVKSDPTVLSRPASITRGCIAPVVDDEQTRVSDSEQSTGHIDFMNDSTNNDNRPMTNILDVTTKSQPVETNPQQTEDGGHVTTPKGKDDEVTLHTNQNNVETSDNTEQSTLNTQVSSRQVSTNTESADCGYQSRSWEIIMQPTTVQTNMSKCLDGVGCGTMSKLSGNKMPVLPSKAQDLEFCGSKTYLVIRPSGPTIVTAGARLSGTTTYPPTKRRSSPGNQPLTSSHEMEAFTSTVSPSRKDDMSPYGWSRFTDDESTVQLQLQRQRLWMNRRTSAANALPVSPMHGPISSCVGTGSTYRKRQDTQLVVPRYSALPRSVSMLVNTSSEDCSSNSNSDSDCLSLADSLEERPSSCTGRHKPTKYDSKLVRGDVVQLLPDERNHKDNLHRRINAATPRGKGKAFFVSMETGLDEAGTVTVDENIDRQVISQSMPVRLKQKLSHRRQQIDLKKKKKKPQNQDEKSETNKEQRNTGAEVESNGEVSLEQMAGPENRQDPTQASQTQAKYQDEGKTTEISVPTQEIGKKSSELHPQIGLLSTAISHTVAQSTTGGGTFIVSRNEGQGQREQKTSQQCTAEGVAKFSSTGNMSKKEKMPKEHNPPIKRLKVSKQKTPLESKHDTPRQEEENISTSETTILKEKKHEEQSPPVKSSNSLNNHAIIYSERNPSVKETGWRNGNSAGNGNKDHDTEKKMECAVQFSTEVQENVKPVNKVTSPEWSNDKVEENVTMKKHITKEQEPPAKTANVSRKKMNKWNVSPQKSDTNNSSKTEANRLKYEDQNLQLKTSLNDMSIKTGDKTTNAQMLRVNGEELSRETLSHETSKSVLKPKKLESKEPKVSQKEPENFENVLKYTTKAQTSGNEGDIKKKVKTGEIQNVKKVPITERKSTAQDAACQQTEHEHSTKPDRTEDKVPEALEKSPEKKSLSTASSQTSPEHKREEKKENSTSNTDPNSNKPELPPDQIRNTIRPQLPLKSSIPIMKSPVGTRKLSPDTVITFQQPLYNSHLPARTPRLQATMRRYANLQGGRFHQRFEVIPEERSGSLESCTEDQPWLTTDRSLRASLPAGQAGTKVSTGMSLGARSNIVSHSCLGLNQTAIKNRQNRHSAPNTETSSRNHEDSSNWNATTTNSDITRKVVRRPTCQSRIPRVEKVTRQPRIPEDMISDGQEKRMHYQGKAALAPHTEDKDLLTLSKGWLNFYLLKDGCSTPDSSCEEGNVG